MHIYLSKQLREKASQTDGTIPIYHMQSGIRFQPDHTVFVLSVWPPANRQLGLLGIPVLQSIVTCDAILLHSPPRAQTKRKANDITVISTTVRRESSCLLDEDRRARESVPRVLFSFCSLKEGRNGLCRSFTNYCD